MTPSTTSPTSDPAAAPSGRTAELTALLTGSGVPAAYVPAAAAHLGERAAARLRDDPWELLLVPGVRPEQADHFARRVLGGAASPDDPRRGRALAVHQLAAAARQGHTAVPAATVVERLLGLKVPDPAAAVTGILDDAVAVALADDPGESAGEDAEPVEMLALARYAMAEEAAAEGFQRLAAEGALELYAGFAAEESALAAFPGAVVAAPTARRAAGLGHGAVTVQELLGASDAAGGLVFARGEQAPVEAGLVVVTDAGTLDVELAAALVEAVGDGTRLVLAGDPAALPPAGPGQVFADLVASRAVPVTRTQSAGPGSETPVERLLGAVREGELAAVDAPGREVVIVPAGGGAEAVHRAVQLVTDSIPRAIGIPAEDVQVVAPASGGEAGTGALNAALKARLNPGEGVYDGFDTGDRVVAAGAFAAAPAGETGVVLRAAGPGLVIGFPGGEVTVHRSHLNRLRHGWAITVQQAAGTRWPAVVAVLAPGPPALSRPLVATAVGRAVRHLSIVQAAGPDLARAVAEVPGTPRRTRLAGLLRGM